MTPPWNHHELIRNIILTWIDPYTYIPVKSNERDPRSVSTERSIKFKDIKSEEGEPKTKRYIH